MDRFLRETDKLVVGGLHRDDFEWAAQQYAEIGYILTAFILDRDGYHWKAIYVKNDKRWTETETSC